MSKRKTDVIENFGERLAQLRKAAGYTQVEFAAEVGITQRMVAYYEALGAQPPAHLLPQVAQVLGVGADVLLGMAQARKVKGWPPTAWSGGCSLSRSWTPRPSRRSLSCWTPSSSARSSSSV
jgi:transcriptional regulator with XRE-family HTH domain